MPHTASWKLTVIGAVAVVAAVPLLRGHWDTEQLASYIAVFFVARGALHLVATPTWVGLDGAAAILLSASELAAGLVILVWPHPTLYVVAIVAGIWCAVTGVAGGTIAVTTRGDEPRWLLLLALALVDVVLGVLLIARANTSVDTLAALLGVVALLHGVVELVLAASHALATRRVRRRGRGAPVVTAAVP
jgi:uncharacterized membrane protein HdeD (DUF308 family)